MEGKTLKGKWRYIDVYKRQVGDGMMEYVSTAGSETWFSAAAYEEPTQPHGTHTDSNGLSWYSVSNGASIPDLSGTDAVHTLSCLLYTSRCV